MDNNNEIFSTFSWDYIVGPRKTMAKLEKRLTCCMSFNWPENLYVRLLRAKILFKKLLGAINCKEFKLVHFFFSLFYLIHHSTQQLLRFSEAVHCIHMIFAVWKENWRNLLSLLKAANMHLQYSMNYRWAMATMSNSIQTDHVYSLITLWCLFFNALNHQLE